MKLFRILVLLLICIGNSNITFSKNKVANSCGYSILTDAYQKHTTCGGCFIVMKEIIIYSKVHGKHKSLVDDEDYEFLISFSWNVTKIKNNFYATFSQSIKNKKTTVYMHRLIMRASEDTIIDHKDRNTLDNQKHNLRVANKSQNASNSKISSRNKSGYKGVWRMSNNRYEALLKHEGKKIIGGYFDTAEQAAIAYNSIAKKYFGEYAFLNKVSQSAIDEYNQIGINNRILNCKNKSGYRGVFFNKTKSIRPYESYITIHKKRRHIGFYDTAKEAALAYNNTAIKYIGDAAKLNIIHND